MSIAEASPAEDLEGKVTDLINQATAAVSTDEGQAVVKVVKKKIPLKVRGVLYEGQKILGTAVAIGPSLVALLDGDVKLYALSALGVVIAAYGFLSKSHLAN